MKSLKNFEAPTTRGDSLNLDYDTLFDGGSYHLIEGDDYDVPAGLTGTDLTAFRNKIILKIKSKGKKFGKVVKCSKVGAAQKMEPGIVVHDAEDATDEQKAEWKTQMEKLKASWKAKLAEKKASKNGDAPMTAAPKAPAIAPHKPGQRRS
jgi:hypothetical protein